MVKEEKRGKPSQKIMPFPSSPEKRMEDLEDAAMDQFLRESVKEEADEIEKALNEDPKLVGVGASDDLFGKIVAELKERGEWEEEGVGKAGLEDNREENKPEKGKKEQENRQEKGQKEQEEGQEEQEDEKNKQEEKMSEGSRPEEEIYKLLSEEDREALEYGRQMKTEKEIREKRRKYRRKRWQRIGVTAAALVLVVGVGMRSEANRRFVLQVWESVANNFGIRIPVNYVEENELHIASDEEQEAYAEIEQKLNIASLHFGYLPEGMAYERYTINEKAAFAVVTYSYQDVFLDIYLKRGIKENAGYYQVDGTEVEAEKVVNKQNIEMNVYRTATNNQEYATAIIESDDNYYYFSGMIPFDEMKKILKLLIILEK